MLILKRSAAALARDGVGVLLVEIPTGGVQIDNSGLNSLVYKYGDAAKALDAPLKDYVLTNISDPVDIAIAEKLNDSFAEGDECDDGNSNTINDVYVNNLCVGVVVGSACDDGNAHTINDTIKSDGTCSGIITSTAGNGLVYENSCKYLNLNDATAYCNSLGMRLPTLEETRCGSASGVPTCSGWTWTTPSYKENYNSLCHVASTGTSNNPSYPRLVRCVK